MRVEIERKKSKISNPNLFVSFSCLRGANPTSHIASRDHENVKMFVESKLLVKYLFLH